MLGGKGWLEDGGGDVVVVEEIGAEHGELGERERERELKGTLHGYGVLYDGGLPLAMVGYGFFFFALCSRTENAAAKVTSCRFSVEYPLQ